MRAGMSILGRKRTLRRLADGPCGLSAGLLATAAMLSADTAVLVRLGMGFAFKAKPEAFASSSCANKVVN